jgi:hypothetical protein
VVQRCGGARLAAETREAIRTIHVGFREELERDLATQGEVPRKIDDAHTSGADPVEDSITHRRDGIH